MRLRYIRVLIKWNLDLAFARSAYKLHRINGTIEASRLAEEVYSKLDSYLNRDLTVQERNKLIDRSYSFIDEIENDVRNPQEDKIALVSPRLGERILLLILTKEERINIPGDLEEEYRGIAAKHGARFAKVWYYRQVAGSAWPMIRKAVRWGLLASVGEWIRRII